MAIKAFLFDCGGVLLQDGDLAAYRVWEERLKLEPGGLAQYLWAGELWELAEKGRITDAEFWRRAGEHLGLSDPAEVARLREELWGTWTVNGRVLALVERVRQRYKVGLLSNATDALEDLLANRYALADRFDLIVNSARVGLAKPERGIYEEALRRLDVQPNEVVFIDDRAANVAAAAALGLHVIWFVHAEELERQLQVYLNRGHENNPPTPEATADKTPKSSGQSAGRTARVRSR